MERNAAAEADPFFRPMTVFGRTTDNHDEGLSRHMIGITRSDAHRLLRIDYTVPLFHLSSRTATRGLFDEMSDLLVRDPTRNGNILRESQTAYSNLLRATKREVVENGLDLKAPRPALTTSFFCDPLTYQINETSIHTTEAQLGGRIRFTDADYKAGIEDPDTYLNMWARFAMAQSALWPNGAAPKKARLRFQCIDEKTTLLAQHVLAEDAMKQGINLVLRTNVRNVANCDSFISTTQAKNAAFPRESLHLPCAYTRNPSVLTNQLALGYFYETKKNLMTETQAARMAQFCGQHVFERQGHKRPNGRDASTREEMQECWTDHQALRLERAA